MRFLEVAPGQVRLAEGDPPVAKPGWAVVRVQACGLCGSDLRLASGMVLPKGVQYPIRPGHEVAGVIASLPQGVAGGPKEGDMVVLHPLSPCGACPACLSGQEQRCPQARVLGIHDPGGMAEMVAWPVNRMLPVTGVSAPEAALLADAVATAHHALRLAAPPQKGHLCVIGAGGVGEQVLRLSRALLPEVTLAAVVRSEASAERVRRLGVSVLAGLDGAAQRLRSEIGRFDAVIDFSGAPGSPSEAVRMLNAGGRLIVGSVGDYPFELGTTISGVATRELQIMGCYVSALSDLRAVAKLVATGRLELAGAATDVMPLSDAPAAFERLRQSKDGVGRLILQP